MLFPSPYNDEHYTLIYRYEHVLTAAYIYDTRMYTHTHIFILVLDICISSTSPTGTIVFPSELRGKLKAVGNTCYEISFHTQFLSA